MTEATERKQRDEQGPEAEGDRVPAATGRARTCVGCGEREELAADSSVLVRLVVAPGGLVAVDAGDGSFGRGAHVHPRASCLSMAVTRGLPRVAKSSVFLVTDDAAPEPLRVETLASEIAQAMDRRIAGLLAAAARARALALGADAVDGACKRGEGHGLVVACDACAAAELDVVRRAIVEGRAVAWGTKESLSQIVSASARTHGVGVIAITRSQLAREVLSVVRVRDACASAAASPGVGAGRSDRAAGLGDKGKRRGPASAVGKSEPSPKGRGVSPEGSANAGPSGRERGA